MGRSFGGTRRRARLLITRLVPSNASSGIATLCILIGVISRCLESCTLDLSMMRRSVECATLILEKKGLVSSLLFLIGRFDAIHGNSVKGIYEKDG